VCLRGRFLDDIPMIQKEVSGQDRESNIFEWIICVLVTSARDGFVNNKCIKSC